MAINESCKSQQTFCKITGQTVNDLIPFTYNPKIVAGDTAIQATIWNKIIEQIRKIYNYGTRGTRNPRAPLDITNFQAVQDTHAGHETADSAIINASQASYTDKLKNYEESILLEDYNRILRTIGLTELTNLNSTLIITEDQFNTLKQAINNYTINADRCNNCNSGCNTSCQVNCNSDCYSAPCMDCYCYDCYCYNCYSTCEGCYSPGGGGCATYCINLM